MKLNIELVQETIKQKSLTESISDELWSKIRNKCSKDLANNHRRILNNKYVKYSENEWEIDLSKMQNTITKVKIKVKNK
ncbi:hypothetical protein HN681_04960 [archaeon]|nr:hypothetical protein [Candidatus Woesearchaeota archaeon]MBT6837678.1 hypothetical protein [Bacteroidota bacterium]MBT7380067.1 hypothetical protein [archaeon]MBT8010768.1 hypothetical protein [archaeon]